MSDVETRLRATWIASEELITDADDPPPMVAAQRRSWRAPSLVAAAVLLIAVGVTVAVNWPTAKRESGSTSAQATPARVLQAAQIAIRGQTVHRLDEPVEWVQTTTKKWAALDDEPNAQSVNAPLYVIQLRGDFDCNLCKGPGASQLRGSTIVTLVPLTDNQPSGGFIFGNTTYDLSKLGSVHTFQLN
jgi:hypothetical protein